MRNYIKHTFFVLLMLALLGTFLTSGVTASATEPTTLVSIGQQVVNTPTELEIISQEIVCQPMLAASTPKTYHSTVADAASELRTALKNHKTSYTVGLKTSTYSQDYALELLNTILGESFCHTGNPKEGDYLRWHFGGCYMSTGGMKIDYYYLTFTYSDILYYSSLEQEVDAAVTTLLNQLNVRNKTDYEKAKAVYDYICNHVTYDYAGLDAYDNGSQDYTPFTTWKALIKGTAVCQGYASLFYRLMLELGVDSRVVVGIGVTDSGSGGHAWNIVKLDDLYYNLDATWDSEYAKWDLDYEYFLRYPANFPDHIRDAEYDTAAFHAAYPMGEKDYQPAAESIPGDMNGDNLVTDADALYLLRHTLFPENYPIAANGDVNNDGYLTDADALYLLRYSLFPTEYPLYPAA